MESVNDTQCKQCAVIQFLLANKHSRINIHKHLRDVYESAAVNRSNTGQCTKRVMALKTGKPEFQDLNTQLIEKPFLLGYWHVTFLSQIVTEDET